MSERRPLHRLDLVVAGTLGVVVFAILLASVGGVGFTRDEGYYFRAAGLYGGWLSGVWSGLLDGRVGDWLRDDAIVRAWGYNAEHPGLMKTLFALSGMLFHDTLGWAALSTAHRMPAMLLAAAMVALVYLFAAEAYSRRVGLVAAGLLATMPRLFHDAHLACFDVPMAAMQLVVVYAYWRGLRSRPWAVLTGVAFGFALATKLNAFFIPAFLGVHAALRALRTGPSDPQREPPAWLAFASMAVAGPLLFLAHWPYLWHHPVARVGDYLQFHWRHEHYPVEYFGDILLRPPFPWSFVFVMTAVTVPLPALTLMTVAAVRGVVEEIARVGGWTPTMDARADDPRLTRVLLLVAGLGPLLVMTLPGVPIFGGVKHWFTSLPFLCILAAAEFDRLAVGARRWLPAWIPASRLGYAAAAIALAVPGALGIRLVHPYGIGFYNELIGSVRGGAEHGMLRNFWGYTSRGNLEALNRDAATGARVFFHRTNREACEMYRSEGLLRHDLEYVAAVDDADWAACDQQRPYTDEEYRVWNEWGARPQAGVYVDEVPMNLLYRRPPRTGGPSP